jgi:hypothetical protein
MRGKFLQCLQFIVRDIGPFAFLEAEDEEPSITLVGRNQGSSTAALSATCKPYPLLHHPTAKVGVNQAPDHFSDSRAKQGVRQLCFPHPAAEMASLEYVSFPRNFVFQEMGYNAPANWKEKRS